MLSDEEKQSIEYLKARLYGNEGCKIIDVAQSDLRIFLKLVKNLQKDIESWKKYCDEQENNITLKNNKICDLEFKIEKQSKEIEELNEKNIQVAYGGRRFNTEGIILKDYISKDKIREIIYPTPENPIELEIQNSKMYKDLRELLEEGN